MKAAAADFSLARQRHERRAQWLKWSVYTLLLLNWVYYGVEEMGMAAHTLRQGGDFLDWTGAFETSLDLAAWFGLLFMFELETYAIGNEAWRHAWVRGTVRGVRLVCYLFLVHTLVVRAGDVNHAWTLEASPEIASPCQLAGQDISWGENYRYTVITTDNCAFLSDEREFFMLEPSVVTDTSGLKLEKTHTAVDLADAITWILVIWAIELAVWLQNRNVTRGWLMAASHTVRVLYLILFANAGWWIWTGHWVWAWDQSLWICGFWAIEHNLSEWREDIRDQAQGRG